MTIWSISANHLSPSLAGDWILTGVGMTALVAAATAALFIGFEYIAATIPAAVAIL